MVDGALGRMEDGSYGRCLNCHREINYKRLESVPWTHYCIDCQTRIEESESGQRKTA
jgi:DnaK suppressor protein